MISTSAEGSALSIAAFMSPVDSTVVTPTAVGASTLIGPDTSMTSAPRRHAADASATPILPLL